MTWVRLDDRFAQHPKVVAAGPLAMAMQVAALGYCNRELTDGFIPRAAARTLLDFEIERDGERYTIAVTSGYSGSDVTAAWVIDGLVASGMWEEVPGGYHIHDYLEYQPSKDEVLALREKRSEAGRVGGLKRGENWREANEAKPKQSAKQNPSKHSSKTEAKSNPTPVPVPTPVNPHQDPDPDLSFSAPEARDKEPYSADFLAFWTAYGPTDGPKRPAFTAWRRLSGEDRAAALAGLPAWHTSRQWREGFKPYPQKYLSQRFWETVPESGPARASPNGRPPTIQDEAEALRQRLRGPTPPPNTVDADFRPRQPP